MSAPTGSAARPFVTLKLATSLDGRIATASGESQWITGAESRARTHELRAAHDAIMVGSGTVLADNPVLTARSDPPPKDQPLRIIADGRLRTPLSSRLIQTISEARLALCVGLDVEDERFDDYLRAGVEIWETPIAPMGGVSISGMLSRCLEEGVERLFVEGGGQLAAAFLRARAIDRIEWFRAPIILGGDGVACLGNLGLERLDEAAQFERVALRESGPDIWESYDVVQATSEEG